MSIILSIGIPTYNRVTHLKRLIKYYYSEIDEELSKKIELIVSNDNSPDNTKEYLESITPCPKWLKIINNNINLGSHGNMCQIINRAQGEYIWLPGDDDYLKIGLISKLIEILSNNDSLSYVFLSRLGIDEKTFDVGKLMKRHEVQYDSAYLVPNNTIISLLMENFGDLKFQSSTIVKRSVALACDEEIKIYSSDTQDDCYSLFRAIRGLQSGYSYFVSDVCVLNGNEISWGDKMVKYFFVSDVEFVEGLSNFGISKKDCRHIVNRLLGAYYFGLITNIDLKRRWKELGKPGLRISAVLSALYLSIRHILFKIHLSNIYYSVSVNILDFGIYAKGNRNEQ